VANGLAWIGQPAQAGLLEAITDRNEEVRRLAIEALKTSRENMVLRAILRASYDENIEVRGAAIEALKEWGEDAIVLRRLTEALSDTARSRLSKMRITEIAVKVLEALGNKDANRILERWREGDLRPDTPSKKSAVVAHDRIKKGSRGQNAFTQHVEALRDSDWQVRRKAVQEIVVIDSAAALPEILPLLKDSDNQVRIAVVKSLAIIGSDGALRGLMQALNDKDPLVSDAAADALKHIGKPALPDLISALRVDNENVRGSVIEILSKIDDATAVPELVECLKDERKPWLHDVRVCDLAAKALEKIGTPDAVKAVRQWRESQHPTMEVGALTPEKLEQQSSEQRQLLQNMLDELRSSEWHVRLNAAKALREYAKLLHHTKEPQVVSRLMEAMDDQNWEVRWAVTEALAWIGDPAAVSALIKHLDDKNWTVRVALIRALLEIGDKQSASYVVPYLKDENANVREAAAETLGVLQYANAVGELMKALSDSERFVRLQAAAALGNIGDKRAVPTMIKLLRESDLEMRWFIVYALGRIGDASAVPILIEHLTDTAMPQWEEKQRICDLAVAALETIGTADAKNAALQWRQQYS
jgi:HEAT repeat protein